MAKQQYLDLIQQGTEVWNTWRTAHPMAHPDLSGADLIEANLSGARFSLSNFGRVPLIGGKLSVFDLIVTDLSEAYLSGAPIIGANLRGADLSGAHLGGADLGGADLSGADLSRADLSYAILSRAEIGLTVFGDVDLRNVKGLETVKHHSPSTIGTDTLIRLQGNIPEVFLCGAGLPDTFIDYIRSLVSHPIDYYTCFISYSSQDEPFAKRLHADLQQQGVRCWFAPEHMDIGDKIRHRIDESIRLYDKLVLILSQASVESTWVAYEVERALIKEPAGIPNVLYPIRLDETVMQCRASWVQDILSTRHIGDFTHWKDHDTYQKSLNRLLRALKPSKLDKE